MKPLACILPLLALAGCEGTTGADGYRFGEAEFERDQVSVTLVQYDSESAFIAAARRENSYKEGIEAFGIVSKSRPECEIHVLRVADHYRPEWLGHELTHCIHGRWHP